MDPTITEQNKAKLQHFRQLCDVSGKATGTSSNAASFTGSHHVSVTREPPKAGAASKLLRALRAEALTSENVDISKQERQRTAENGQVDHRETAALLATESCLGL